MRSSGSCRQWECPRMERVKPSMRPALVDSNLRSSGRTRRQGPIGESTGSSITRIRSKAPARTHTYLTSNKSLIGHTGWAAGVVSVIQVLLSLREETILPQHRFTRTPDSYELDGSAFEIPTESKPWLARPEPRRAAISGFGFGGTNAPLVVWDRPNEAPPPRDDAPAVIVGWGADLPGLGDADEIARWARTGHEPPACSFGDTYDATGLAL